MANQTVTYGAESKFTGVNVLPEKLVIVGIDCEDDEMPDLADPDRVRLALDPAMVANIAEHGVREPVKIRKFHGDDRVFVVAGRRRVLCAREANRRLKDDCKILVPCVPEDKTFDPLTALVIENEFRRDDTPLARARKAQRMRARGATDAQIRTVFGISQSGLKGWWSLLESSPAVQKAVEAGKISASVGADLGKLAPAKQADALRRAIEAGKGSAAKEAVRASRPNGGGTAPQRLSAKHVKAFANYLVRTDNLPSGLNAAEEDAAINQLRIAHATLRAITGEGLAAFEDFPVLRDRLQSVLSPAREEKTTEVASS